MGYNLDHEFIASGLDMSVIALKKPCDGLDMTITDFFADDIFRNIEQEIK